MTGRTPRTRAQAGETLVETLAAILICVFASLVLTMAVGTATELNVTARNYDAAYVEVQEGAELLQGASSSGSVTIEPASADDSATSGATISVTVYGSSNGYGQTAYSYVVTSGGGGGTTIVNTYSPVFSEKYDLTERSGNTFPYTTFSSLGNGSFRSSNAGVAVKEEDSSGEKRLYVYVGGTVTGRSSSSSMEELYSKNSSAFVVVDQYTQTSVYESASVFALETSSFSKGDIILVGSTYYVALSDGLTGSSELRSSGGTEWASLH